MERLGDYTRVVSSQPKGTQFVRCAIALAAGGGSLGKAVMVARERWPYDRGIEEALTKSAVDVGTTTDSDWAAPLSPLKSMANEFIEALRPASIVGRIPGFTPAPTQVNIPRAISGSSSSWVGQAKPTPVSRMTLETVSMGPMKISTIVVLSNELVQDSRPSAEALIRRDMLASVAAYSDAQFIDPTVSAGADNPASITNGITPRASTGSSVAQITADVQAMFAGALAAGHSFANGVWVMHPRTALYLSSALTAGNSRMWPEISVKGGTWFGLPVITSASVPIDTGADTYIALLDAPEILFADGPLTVDVAREASLQMDSNPTDAAASQVSLWQNNLAALKVVRHVNYERRRDTAVAIMSGVSY
jgi:HK97 family phage major capsid protein